jgi:hypothetical protein
MSAAWFPPGIEKPKQSKNVGVWEVFVQILLPLVLLLTFVVMQIINNYMDKTQNVEQISKALAQYTKDLDRRNVDQEYQGKQKALLDLQYQILLNALQQIEEEKRKEAKLNVFSGRVNHIQRNKTKVTDSEFQMLCRYAANIFNTGDVQQFRDGIYKTLLEHVFQSDQIQDVSADGSTVQKHANLPEMDDDSIRIAHPNQVTDVNRAKIHNEIIEFTNQLRDDVLTIQQELLQIIAQERMTSLEGLDQESKQLVREIIDSATDAQIREARVNEFFRSMTKKWRKELEDDGYYFLNMLWDEYNAL